MLNIDPLPACPKLYVYELPEGYRSVHWSVRFKHALNFSAAARPPGFPTVSAEQLERPASRSGGRVQPQHHLS